MQKMINFHDVTKENIKECNSSWLQTFDNPYIQNINSWRF